MITTSLVRYRIAESTGNRFAFQVAKTGLMRGKKHFFEFTRYSGQWRFCPDAPEESTIELTIAADSIVLKDDWIGRGDAKRVLKMATTKMLSVATHPELTFASSRVVPHGDGRFDVEGRLTLRGVARPASITVAVATEGHSARLSGEAVIRLTDFGLTPPAFLFGVIGTRNEVAVEFDLSAWAAE